MTQTSQKLLVVEDDVGLQKQLRWALGSYDVIFAETRDAALAAVRRHEPAVVIQDLGLPPEPDGVTEGLRTLQDILAIAPDTKVVVVTGKDDRANAVRAVGLGAFDFYSKPMDPQILGLVIERALRIYELERENRALLAHRQASPLEGIIASSASMRKTCALIEKVAPTNASVLLLGESGTGKEVLARALHALSPRASRPFCPISCAAIPETLLESELFGYERGAFTGAAKTTPGKLEHANGGTLLLDEIGDMPHSLQVKLLRFLQERVIERVGGRESIPIDVRVVSATNRDLKSAIERGEFREDLFYRISEVTVNIPPLRDRESDSVVIAHAVLAERARQHARPIRGFTADAIRAIQACRWPGNIRELENKVNSAVIVSEGNRVTAADLGLAEPSDAQASLNLRVARQRVEEEMVRRALAVATGNLSEAAELLGITRPTLYDLLNRLGIRAGDAAVAIGGHE